MDTKVSGTNRDSRGTFIFLLQLATGRIGNHTWLMSNMLKVITIHTYTLYPFFSI